MSRAILVDSNLLVVLLVGATSRDHIERFHRTRHYSTADYDLLVAFLGEYDTIVVTPHVLTEVSNLVGQLDGRLRTECLARLASLVPAWREEYISAATLVQEGTSLRLGLTDSSVHRAAAGSVTVLTDDLALYLATSSAGRREPRRPQGRPHAPTRETAP